MKTLTLKNKFQTNVTLITNEFIDDYMANANGEFVKVYIFLLRHLGIPCSALTISTIADCLNNTENDILRALRYWESEGLLSLDKDDEGRIIGIELERAPSISTLKVTSPDISPVSEKAVLKEVMPAGASLAAAPKLTAVQDPAPASAPSHTLKTSDPAELTSMPEQEPQPMGKAIPLTSFKAQKELKSLLFIAEQYLGKTLSHTDVEAITYFYETLSMSADLIEYLIESCVENGHKSMHYIRKVALSWSDDGIKSAEQARRQSKSYNKSCYTVLNAFGIKNRGPAAAELVFINKWSQELGFSLDIIQEACNRTITATHQPSFEYADSILTKWHTSQVRHLQDIAVLDAAFQKEKTTKIPSQSRQKPVSKNMNNFERRTYDMDSLEEQLLNSN